jgi:hypothetical protein
MTTTSIATVTKGLLVRLEAQPRKEDEAERFLVEGRSLVAQEPDTTAWFAVRFGRAEYGIFDVFPDNRARLAHLTGRVPREHVKHALGLLGSLPDMGKSDVLAAKLG